MYFVAIVGNLRPAGQIGSARQSFLAREAQLKNIKHLFVFLARTNMPLYALYIQLCAKYGGLANIMKVVIKTIK